MILRLAPPPGWSTESVGGRSSLRPSEPGLVLVAAPLVPRAAFDLNGAVGQERPPLSRVDVLQAVDMQSATGWHMRLITAAVRTPGAPDETRLAAVYDVIHWAGFAMAIASAPDVYERHRETVLGVLVGARPDLRAGREAVCVKDLWELI